MFEYEIENSIVDDNNNNIKVLSIHDSYIEICSIDHEKYEDDDTICHLFDDIGIINVFIKYDKNVQNKVRKRNNVL